MKYFSVPADFKIETIDALYELNQKFSSSKVVETYGQVTTGTVLSSGRVTNVLPEVDFRHLEYYVEYSIKKGIEFNYTLNPSCFGNMEFSEYGIEEIIGLLDSLNSIGVSWLTLTSPSLVELVKHSSHKFKLKASAICEINSPGKAAFYKMLDVDRIVIDPDITRDFKKIRNICKVCGDTVEMIVNNVCYKNCAYKMFHYNHEAHCTTQNASQCVKDYYFNRCSMQKAGKIVNFIKLNWVRPEDINFYYESGVRFFKIQGRQNVLQGDVIKTLECYCKEDFNGNLLDLITIFSPYNAFQPYIDNKKLDGFIAKFYDNPNFCTEMCDECGYCEKYALKCMNPKEADKLNAQALNFYKSYDEFTRLVKRKEHRKTIRKLFDEESLESKFDFE
ncbi:MAG: U32 family peptidase [Caulobacteraceae bacterium]